MVGDCVWRKLLQHRSLGLRDEVLDPRLKIEIDLTTKRPGQAQQQVACDLCRRNYPEHTLRSVKLVCAFIQAE